MTKLCPVEGLASTNTRHPNPWDCGALQRPHTSWNEVHSGIKLPGLRAQSRSQRLSKAPRAASAFPRCLAAMEVSREAASVPEPGPQPAHSSFSWNTASLGSSLQREGSAHNKALVGTVTQIGVLSLLRLSLLPWERALGAPILPRTKSPSPGNRAPC